MECAQQDHLFSKHVLSATHSAKGLSGINYLMFTEVCEPGTIITI